MNLGNSYSQQRTIFNKEISEMSIFELKPLLCGKSNGNPVKCYNCVAQCSFGKRAIQLLNEETQRTVKTMSKKQISDASKKVEAMQNYLDAISAPDPIAYLMEKYNISEIKTAKSKLYQWQHNYGKNPNMISEEIRRIKNEIQVSKERMNKESSETKKPEIKENSPEEMGVEKKPTKRQEEKISQEHLERMRTDYENRCIELEKEIEDHKKGIEDCEKEIESIVEKVKSIRAVLDIFKEKKSLYV